VARVSSALAVIYDQLSKARNDALHLGALARHMTSHAVIVALVVEDGLMNGLDRTRGLVAPSARIGSERS
jgi:hypothetical protein